MDTNQTNRGGHRAGKGIYVTYLFLLFALVLLTACGGGGARPTPTPFPTPIVPEKPTYIVQRGTVARTLEFRGRVSPVTEKELFFKADGYVRDVHVAQGDLVEAGDLLAELEIGDLENQLAQYQVVLQTAELRLSQAEQEHEDALSEAKITLQKARLQLSQAEQANADALAEADITLQKAELQLSQAEQANADALAEAEIALQEAELQLGQAEQANADALAEARITLEKARLAQAAGLTEADVAAAQSAVNSAEAQLEQLLVGPDEQSVEIARLNWELALNKVWQAQLERDATKGRDGVPGYQKDLVDAAVGFADISARVAQLQYELAGKGATDEEISIAQAAVDQARAQAVAARDNYSYTVQLQAKEFELAELLVAKLERGVDPLLAQKVELAKLRVEELERGVDPLLAREVELAKLRVAKLKRGVDPLLAQEVELAELRVARLERGTDPLLAQEVEKARIDLQRIQGRIEDARLVAPFDGRILSLSVREGGQAIAFKSALILGDPGALEITADLGADKLSQMSVGQTATIRLLNRPEQDWLGHVRQLPYPYGGGAGGQGEGDEATRISLDDPEITLEIGELATVTILLEQKDDVLWLPPAAIRSFQARDFVVIQDADHQWRADVHLGLESEERIEILEGVEEGQVVVGP
jgi:HlyD family secretion protein